MESTGLYVWCYRPNKRDMSRKLLEGSFGPRSGLGFAIFDVLGIGWGIDEVGPLLSETPNSEPSEHVNKTLRSGQGC